MLLAKAFQQPTSQPLFQQITMPVSTLKQPPTSVVTLERPFIQPPTGTSEMPALQSTRSVSQVTATQNQPLLVPVRCKCYSRPDKSASLLPVRLLPVPEGRSTTSVTAATAQQDPDSDFEQQANLTSLVYPMEEEGEVLTKRLVCQNKNWINSSLKSITTRKLSGVSGLSWGGTRYQNLRVQPQDDNPFVRPRTQPTDKNVSETSIR